MALKDIIEWSKHHSQLLSRISMFNLNQDNFYLYNYTIMSKFVYLKVFFFSFLLVV